MAEKNMHQNNMGVGKLFFNVINALPLSYAAWFVVSRV